MVLVYSRLPAVRGSIDSRLSKPVSINIKDRVNSNTLLLPNLSNRECSKDFVILKCRSFVLDLVIDMILLTVEKFERFPCGLSQCQRKNGGAVACDTCPTVPVLDCAPSILKAEGACVADVSHGVEVQ